MRPIGSPPRLGGVRRDAPVPPPIPRPAFSEPEPFVPEEAALSDVPGPAPGGLRRLPPGAALWRATVAPPPAAQAEAPVPVLRLGARRIVRGPGAPAPQTEEPQTRQQHTGEAEPPAPVAPVAPADPPGETPVFIAHRPQPAADALMPDEGEAFAEPRIPHDRPPAPLAAAPPPAAEAPMGVIALEPLRRPRRWRRTDAPGRRRDPAPSRIAYRLNRLWLTPLVRSLVRVGLPAWLLVMAAGLVIGDAERQARLIALWQDLRAGVENRPEFQVTAVEIEGASDPVAAALAALGPQEFPVSSFRLDLDALRLEFEALDAVARAELRVRPDGTLVVAVTERMPVAIWRTGEGLSLVDAEGYRIARLLDRATLPDLPLIAGAGAEQAVAEALELAAAAEVLGEAFIGLLRVGGRRWDVVLDGGLRIQLPEAGALAALERVLAQNDAEELLYRDVAVVDMRLPGRPTVRLNPAAVEEMRRIRALEAGGTRQ